MPKFTGQCQNSQGNYWVFVSGVGTGVSCKYYTTDSLDLDILDEVVPVHSDEAVTMANELWMIGLPVGASSGGESLMNNVTAKKE